MTVSTQINRADYVGNGATTVFAVAFPFYLASDLEVYLDGNLQSLNTHYTVSITLDLNGAFSSASVTFLTAPANTKPVAIVRKLPLTQSISTTNNSQLLPSIVEKGFDRLTLIVQDLLSRLNRIVQLDASVPGSVTLTPDDGKYIAWDGTTLVNKSAPEVAADAGSALSVTVSQHTANIATNTADIATNTADIATLETIHVPTGYINTPVPQYATARTVTVNGTAAAKSGDGLYNLLAAGNNTVSLNTTGLNGLATGTVANNTWYYLYLVSLSDGTGGGYLFDTAQNVNSHVISGVTYRSRQLPLAVRTDASSNILPFYLVGWQGRSSSTRYATQLNGATSGLTGSPTVIGLISSATYSAFSLASFVPPPSRVATLFAYARGGGAVLFRTTGDTNEYSYDLAGGVQSRELTIRTNSSQSIDARVTVNGCDIAVMGYTINL